MDATFDELYVLSDLHIGGLKPRHAADPDLRIFDQHELLRDTLKALAKRARPNRRVGVVLNGDVFDFLAQAGVQPKEAPRYFFPEEAAAWIDAVAADFPEVFEGLAAVVKAPHAALVIVVGNHDLELALPAVQARLRQVLGDSGGLRFYTDGAGFRATVGGASVLCTHGERSDSFNAVDHDLLRKVARAQRDGQAVAPWLPTPGHGMVIDVLNPVKVRYPFVDLFQPQDDRVILLYRWVDPELDSYRPAISGHARAASGRDLKLLSVAVTDGEAALPSAPAVEVLAAFDQGLADEVEPDGVDDLVELVDGDGLLSWRETMRKVAYLYTPSSWSNRLYEWLLEWATDQSAFSETSEDDCSKWARTAVGAGVTYVVCGHTHTRKHIRWPGGRAYFNSGTWIPLLKVTRQRLEDPEPLRALLRSRSRESLEQLIERVPTVVRFLADGTAELTTATRDAAGAVQLLPVVVNHAEVTP
jgi:UDP-2,3-diacylglucosamine pyrophosphatase LpxH